MQGGTGIEEVLVVDAVVHVGVDGEVAHAERCQVLEEVGALAGIHAVVGQAGFHDNPGRADVGPLHGDAQPRVAAAPASGADEDVVAAFVEELLVDFFDFPSYLLVVRGAVVVGFHVDDVVEVVHDAVPQGVVGAQQQAVVGDGSEVFVEHGVVVHDGAYLKQIEGTRLVFLTAHGGGKLDFYRAAHFFLAVFQGQLQDARQGEDVVLKDVGEGDDLASARIQAVADNLVVGVVGRGDVVERAVLFSFLDVELQQVEAVVDGEIVSRVAQVEGVEAGLRFFQREFQLAGL